MKKEIKPVIVTYNNRLVMCAEIDGTKHPIKSSYRDRSKHVPHQGGKEKARRLRQFKLGWIKGKDVLEIFKIH